MSELILSKSNTNNIVFQMMEMFADLIAEKVDYRLKESEKMIIPVETETIKDENDLNELLKIAEVCDILKIKRGALNDWRVKGILNPDTYVGNSPRYKRSSLQAYIDSKI